MLLLMKLAQKWLFLFVKIKTYAQKFIIHL